MSKVAEEFAEQGLIVLAPNAWDEDKATVRDFVRKQKLKQRVLMNGSDVAEAYGIVGVPTTIWIDRNGVMINAEVGFDSAASLRRHTESLLKGS